MSHHGTQTNRRSTMLTRRVFLKGAAMAGMAAAAIPLVGSGPAIAQTPPPPSPQPNVLRHKVTAADRKRAATSARAAGLKPGVAGRGPAMPDPGGIPHYFGPYANYANSPMPKGPVAVITVEDGGSGYSATPTVTIDDVYGTGSGATATATVVGGVITAIGIDAGGSDYSAPIVTIEDATGEGAVASAIIGGVLTGGIRKFIDRMPGLGSDNANLLGQYIPVAIADTDTYPGCDYYEIELGQYTEQLHTDLPPTTLRGYRQTNTTDATVSAFHYLGPLILCKRDVPVRIKFTNALPTGSGGDLFIPVDKTVMGAGMGPLDMPGMPGMKEEYTQNRATVHLHGAFVPWISDGTPHQWTTPAGETTQYPEGVSVSNVPDMWFDPVTHQPVPAGTPGATNDPGPGSLTFYYNNQQSARLMFYHDHAYGITRLNVYAGEAAGYLLTDQVEKDLIDGTNVSGVNPGLLTLLPDLGIPLIIQDRTFVDADTIGAQDPTWNWGTGTLNPVNHTRAPKTGDLWLPSVYMPAQNPWANDLSGASAFGRWQYGPWFWPPTSSITHGPIPNEYYQPDPLLPNYSPWDPPVRPDMPNPSMGMEAFMDTPLVNGTAYPYLEVEPKTYRFRILNAADDRFLNLHMYVADPAFTNADGTNTEVKMVPAMKTAGFPATWSTDGREGGVPDPATAGPAWIQIGTEGGFLPAPVEIPAQPINWNMNATAFNVGNVTDHSLLLGCAERADVLVDFSQFAGQTLILYNDAPTAFPALDSRYDYYTGNPNQMDTGGAPTTQPGYGPNTRTIMQIRVANTTPETAYDVDVLKEVFAKSATKPGVFEVSQDPILIPQAAYNSAYNGTFPTDVARQFVTLFDTSKTFTPIGAASPVTIQFNEKAIHDEMGAAYDTEYGRMSGLLGLELIGTTNLTQNIILYGFASPPVDVLRDSMTPIGTLTDGTQIWKITHNGVDTHPVHFHLFNVQLINRVAWDGALLPPEPNELGWKETVRMNPLESTIVALRPVAPTQPFEVPNCVRLIDPTMPENAVLMTPPGGFVDPDLNAVTIRNHKVNYGWEYVWHCHILSHEEMDMMHTLAFAVAPAAPTNLVAALVGNGNNQRVRLTWTDNSVNETGFIVQRASAATGPWSTLATVQSPNGPGKGGQLTYDDGAVSRRRTYFYRVLATNVVGDTTRYGAGAVGFPTRSVNSVASNVRSITMGSGANAFIMADSFEAGLGAWAQQVGNVLVSPLAAVGADGGANGLAATIVAALRQPMTAAALLGAYVVDTTPSAEVSYDASFYFDPNAADTGLNNNDDVTIFLGLDATGRQLFGVRYEGHGSGSGAISGWVLREGDLISTESFEVSNAPHKIEIGWLSNAQGGFSLYVDDMLVESIFGDTSAFTLDEVRLGPSIVPAGASGTMFFDQFDSNRANGVQYRLILPKVVS